MQLPTEHERPKKVIVKTLDDGRTVTQKVLLSDDEWRERLALQEQEKERMAEISKNEPAIKKEQELQEHIYQYMFNALCKMYFMDDDSELKRLKGKYLEIENKFNRPTPGVSSATKDRIE